jgi:tetratricopeptide (TPR) repeat protein
MVRHRSRCFVLCLCECAKKNGWAIRSFRNYTQFILSHLLQQSPAKKPSRRSVVGWMTTTNCCADCGKEGGGVSLKACKSCMTVKYCNAECQRNHWPTHKKDCKLRAAEIRDEALVFKDPPPKEDCPICFLPMPNKLICCVSLPPATIMSVPIYDYAIANEEAANEEMEQYYPCCGKNICSGCIYSFRKSGNASKCPFCNSDRSNKTEEERVEELRKRVEANDPASICMLANFYYHGRAGFQQDHAKAIELYARAANLGDKEAHNNLAGVYHEGGDMKKAKFYFEAAAMAGHEEARCMMGFMEASGNIERAIKHWTIGASAGSYMAMHMLRKFFEKGQISRESIDSILVAYNSSCAEMRSEARDAFIQYKIETI